MLIFPGIEAIGLSLYLKDFSTLVISDLQLGYEEYLNKKGLLLPRYQLKEIISMFEPILKSLKPKTVILDGDIKHEFGDITESEWRLVLKFIDLVSKYSEVKLIKGNHDVQLMPILKKRNFKIADHISMGEIYVCHGHAIPKDAQFKRSRVVIIGHEHPAISLRDDGRVEKFKCFLKGRYKDKTLIVLPSMNPLTEGTDVMKEKLLSPFLKDGVDDFFAYVVSEEILDFGKIADLRKKLNN